MTGAATWCFAVLGLLGSVGPRICEGHGGGVVAPGCAGSLSANRVLQQQWPQQGATSVRVELPSLAGREGLLRISEEGVDLEAEVVDRSGAVVSRAASPLERAGTQWVFLSGRPPDPAAVVITSKEPAKLHGRVRMDLWVVPARTKEVDPKAACPEGLKQWADGDRAYAAGRRIELGREAAQGTTAHEWFETAARKYQASLQELSGSAFGVERAELQLLLAALYYYELHDWQRSAEWAEVSATSFGTLGADYKRARAQAIQAAAWLELGTRSQSTTQVAATPRESRERLDRARALLRELARFHAGRHEEYEESLQVNNIGVAYIYEARFERAIPYLNQARRVFERLAEPVRVAVALQNLALCEWGLGHLSAALPEFDAALQRVGPTPFPNLYLVILNNSGLAHYAAGQFDRSLQLQAQALDFATRSQADRDRARSYYGMGLTYYAVGNRTVATDFLRRALEIATPALDARIRVATLRALASIEHETGHDDEAIAHNSEALRLATASSARARILLRLAQDYASHGDPGTATRLIENLVAHPPQGDALVRAAALVQRGGLERLSGDWSAAERDLTDGLATLEQYDSLAERFEAQVELARLQAAEGQSAKALTSVRAALRLGPEILAQTANPEYRASITQSLRPALAFELELLRARYDELVHEGATAAAERVASTALLAVDELRATAFDAWRAERLEEDSDPQVGHLLAEETTLYRQMAERRFQLATRDDRAGPADSRARALREDIGRMRVRLDVINTELAQRTVGASSRSNTAPAAGDWLAQRSRLSPGTAVIAYWIGAERAYGWRVSRTEITWVELGASAAISASARKLHDAMKSLATVSKASRLQAGGELYRLVIAPIVRDQSGGIRTVILVPDGALHYVPFAALRSTADSGAGYLAQQWVISVAPAVRFALAPRSRIQKQTGRRVLIVADPVYSADDPRLAMMATSDVQPSEAQRPSLLYRGSGETPSLARLDSSAREARQIRALFDPRQVDLLEGLQATRDELVTRNLASYRVIHIASHGWIDAEIPQLSALILGSYGMHGAVADPYFRAGDFLGRTLEADAVVLSACDTALGAESTGEGLVGLRYAALARGAHSVVASLWPVSDGIAADLMTGMYRELTAARDTGEQGPATTVAERVALSLTGAVRQLLQRSPEIDPALWAAFTVYVAGD